METQKGRGGGRDAMQKYGFDSGLDFGGWNEDTGGDEGPPSSSASDSPKDPQDGDILFLVPDESMDSIWSNDDSGEGTLTAEPVFHDPLSGPSPSQRIVEDWRRSNTLILTPPLSISSASSLLTSSSPFSVPSRKASHGKKNILTTALFSPKKHSVSKTHSSFRRTKARAHIAMIRILVNLNAQYHGLTGVNFC